MNKIYQLYIHINSDEDFPTMNDKSLYNQEGLVSAIYIDESKLNERLKLIIEDSLSVLRYNPYKEYLNKVVDDFRTILNIILKHCIETNYSGFNESVSFGNQNITICKKTLELNNKDCFDIYFYDLINY